MSPETAGTPICFLFSGAEQKFIRSFCALWDETAEATQEDIFDEHQLRTDPKWVKYVEEAQAGLKLFLERGKFSDDQAQF